eukprot:668206-Prymnesium_polylepis.1
MQEYGTQGHAGATWPKPAGAFRSTAFRRFCRAHTPKRTSDDNTDILATLRAEYVFHVFQTTSQRA